MYNLFLLCCRSINTKVQLILIISFIDYWLHSQRVSSVFGAQSTHQILNKPVMLTARLMLPACFMSPMRMMCGQCCRVLAKNGLVTPRTTDGL